MFLRLQVLSARRGFRADAVCYIASALESRMLRSIEQAVIDGLARVQQDSAESAQASDVAYDDDNQVPLMISGDEISQEASAPVPQGTLIIDASVAEQKMQAFPGMLPEAL